MKYIVIFPRSDGANMDFHPGSIHSKWQMLSVFLNASIFWKKSDSPTIPHFLRNISFLSIPYASKLMYDVRMIERVTQTVVDT